MSEQSCIFCRIAEGDIPCSKIYEDDIVLAFLDIAPVHPGHALLIPKIHFANLLEFPSELAPAIISALKKVGAAVMDATGASAFNVMQNNGFAAGQTVFHIHWHIIPRFDGDGLVMWPQGNYVTPSDMQEMASRVISCLSK